MQQHIVDRAPWTWQENKPMPLLLWMLWSLCALFCMSAAINTGITGMTFGIPFIGVITSLVLRGYARPASFGLLFLCSILKFSQDNTSTLYYNGIGDEVTIRAAEFCPNTGGPRPYLSTLCANPTSLRFKRSLGKVPSGNYTVTAVDAEYDDFSTRYFYVVDTPYGPARVSPTKMNVTWSDGSDIDESRILKDVPRWLSMLMFYPQLPLVLFKDSP
jgi:hypothetical protein